VNTLLYGLYSASGSDRVLWSVTRNRLRILAYHGVCADHVGTEAWVPPFFVTESAFRQQMAYVKRHACVLPLGEAVARLRANDLPPRAVSVTFDDGYANNLHLAYPILREYGVPATVFLATAYMQTGDLFPFDRVQLLATLRRRRRQSVDYERLIDYRNSPLDVVLGRLDRYWREEQPEISAQQRETLRPLRADEILQFDPALVEFGAHTHQHCILRNESAGRRRQEITESIHRAGQLAGRRMTLFSYPNGRPGDFSAEDGTVLRSAGIDAAVTTLAGTNCGRTKPLELRRYSIGLCHTRPGFAAEITGFRAWMGRV
jgi:peptidoglycan/xylan/chitin deacetylase (PgdA/CDA1 family)